MERVSHLFVIMATGVIIANLVANPQGTAALLGGINTLWSSGLNAMLGVGPVNTPGGGTNVPPSGVGGTSASAPPTKTKPKAPLICQCLVGACKGKCVNSWPLCICSRYQ